MTDYSLISLGLYFSEHLWLTIFLAIIFLIIFHITAKQLLIIRLMVAIPSLLIFSLLIGILMIGTGPWDSMKSFCACFIPRAIVVALAAIGLSKLIEWTKKTKLS